MGFWIWDSVENVATEVPYISDSIVALPSNINFRSSGIDWTGPGSPSNYCIKNSIIQEIRGNKDRVYFVTNDNAYKWHFGQPSEPELEIHETPTGTGIYASVSGYSFPFYATGFNGTNHGGSVGTAFMRQYFEDDALATQYHNMRMTIRGGIISHINRVCFSTFKRDNISERWLPVLPTACDYTTLSNPGPEEAAILSPLYHVDSELGYLPVPAYDTCGVSIGPYVTSPNWNFNWYNCDQVDFSNGQYGGLSSHFETIGYPRIVTNFEFKDLTGTTIGGVDDDDDDISIYTPGGDTSGDPYNPYPGGSSGSNPGTNDPLNSGTDTTSTSTPGTWVLPFDEVPDTPSTVHSVDLGLYNVYALSAAQVKELANYLFSGVTEVGENLVKLIWGSKRDVIISLYEFPLMVTTQGTDTIRFIFDTDLAGLFHGKQLTSEYIPIDFGTIQVDRYSGTFYDFEPYTTLTLYIPYIGYIDLKPTEVVGSTLSIRGYVHLTTGEINVNVRSSRTGILGSYSGTIGRMLPIADADATEIYSSIIKTAASLGAVALAGAGMATASRAAAGISAPNKQTVDSARDTYMQAVGAWGAATRGVRGLEASMLQAQGSYEKAQADFAEQSSKYNTAQSAVRANREDFHDSASDAISNSLDAVTTGFGVSRGTVMTSSNGRVSPQRCFLRIEIPHQNVSRQQKILGYPANTSDALNSGRLHGYTELRTIELSIPNATLTEIQELEDILRGGFYLP